MKAAEGSPVILPSSPGRAGGGGGGGCRLLKAVLQLAQMTSLRHKILQRTISTKSTLFPNRPFLHSTENETSKAANAANQTAPFWREKAQKNTQQHNFIWWRDRRAESRRWELWAPLAGLVFCELFVQMCTSKVHTRGPATNALLSEIPSLGDTSTFCKERGGCAVRSLLADRTNAHTSLPRPLRPQVSDPGSPRFDQNGVRLPAPAPRRRPSRTHIPPALHSPLNSFLFSWGGKGIEVAVQN